MTELPFALELWDNAARASLPWWLYLWLGFLVLTFLTSIVFVRRHPAARWALGGFVASHVLVVVIEASDLAVVRRGLVSLLHVLCWAPALLPLVAAARAATDEPRFRAWCWTLVGVIAVAFVFDLRDGISYLYHLASGHPALAG